ncbi:hypothetical protein LRP31_33340 (plasmid) [Mesorhizobium mediterraneum]|uniref:Transposase n=1 Tax=Mesorhizobium mediterraneum TaxID=43617 RepID=A0AB36R2A4_9HYPH|nr:hypothetical protein [Mesorhizobium mediterraneum]PAP98631.1 hypothetical protein CIT25_29515 [Mesorhizobium mediterraneum]RWN29503.1 MAG: hypothetical protein EOR96_31740 [Mesorhizobium sp.]WIW57031.1 hypothetical protein LRP31_33340 [Mesorhizobium mediterraneum]
MIEDFVRQIRGLPNVMKELTTRFCPPHASLRTTDLEFFENGSHQRPAVCSSIVIVWNRKAVIRLCLERGFA